MSGEEERVRVRRTQKDYSLAFKMQVIYEVEKGELSYKEAQRKYQIQGRSTVLVWLRKHGTLDWKGPRMKNKPSPSTRIQELEKQLRRLQQEKEILNRAIDIADQTLNTDIRKKYLPLLRKASAQQQGEEKDTASD